MMTLGDAIHYCHEQAASDCPTKEDFGQLAGWLEELAEYRENGIRYQVRCKDCVYRDKVDEHELWCTGNGYPARLVAPDEYCSHGIFG